MHLGFLQRTPRKYVGSYRPKIDSKEKASGRTQYLEDLSLQMLRSEMLFCKVLRSPYPHARIVRLNTDKAECLEGVEYVLRYNDPEMQSLKPTSHTWTGIAITPYDRDTLPRWFDRKVLDSTARYVGDELGVVVAATSEAIAEEAIRLVEVEWEILPFAFKQDDALKEGAPVIHAEINKNGNILPNDPRGTGEWGDDYYMLKGITNDIFRERGDVEKAFKEADITVDVTTTYPNSNHVTLDSMGCLIHWTDEKLTCWTNHFHAAQCRIHLSEMLEIPLNKIRVITGYTGGHFGRWNCGDQNFYLWSAILSKRTQKPVRFKYSRKEDFHDTRNPIEWNIRLAANKNKTITAVSLYGLGDTGAYTGHMGYAMRFAPMEMDDRFFAHIPNLKLEGYIHYSNKIPAGCMRGIGNVQLNLALGIAIDELAEKLDVDPIQLSLNNFGQVWGKLPDNSLEAVLKEGKKKIKWNRRHKAGKGKIYKGTRKRGIGFSFHNQWHAEWEEVPRGHIQAGIKINPDLSVILEAPFCETGGGSNSCVVMACAEQLSFLGVGPEDIVWVNQVDTETGLRDCHQTDSVVSFLQAELMPEIAAKAKEKILELASIRLKEAIDYLDIEDGLILNKKNPGKNTTVKEILWEGDLVPIAVTLSRVPNGEVTGVPYGAMFVEVEVDIKTGEVDILKMVICNDLGTVMYASGAEGQQIGGQCIGVGESLTEEIIYDERLGVPLNFNLVDYKVPTMLDFPEDIDPVLMEVWKGAGEYGACGLGEGPMSWTPTAICNAIYNAVGVRIYDPPVTPNKLLNALTAKNSR